MDKPVISIKDLSKRYYIGSNIKNDQGGHGFLDTILLPYKALKNTISSSDNINEKTIWALKDISLDVYHGDKIGIIGRNGAGKSTLLKILSRLVYPTKGEVIIRGRVKSLLEIGTGFNPNLTGKENIYMNATLHGLKRAEINNKYTEIVEFSGVGKFINTPVKYYSTGMSARLGFAVAAHLDPDILLLDEVLAVGDMDFQNKCLKKVDGLASSGRTILFVSHSMGSIVQFCDKVLWIDNGKMRFLGEATTGIHLYQQEIETENKKSLSERTERRGTGMAKITNFRVFNKNKNICDFVKTGDCFFVELDYEFQEKLHSRPKHVFVNLVFSNEKGVRIFGVPSEVISVDMRNLGDHGRFICRIDSLPLLPGMYNVQVGFLVNRQLVDKLPSAFKLLVVEGDYYGTGKLPRVQFGNICTKYNWEHIS